MPRNITNITSDRAPLAIRAGAVVIRRLPLGRYRLMNLISRRPPTPFWASLPDEYGGHVFECNLQDGIAREVCFTGRYEPQETMLLERLLEPGMTFVDVGANWGYFTLVAAHLVTAAGRVISVEADPRIFRLLETNIAANALEHVTPLCIAAADKDSVMELLGFEESEENWGLSKLHGAAVSEVSPATRAFSVQARRLDDVVRDLEVETIDLLKMDIEGAEGLALMGLSEMLRERRVRRLLVEIHPTLLPDHGHSTADVVNMLLREGYAAWVVNHASASFRRAAYSSSLEPSTFLAQWNEEADLGDWPHILWTSPNAPLDLSVLDSGCKRRRRAK